MRQPLVMSWRGGKNHKGGNTAKAIKATANYKADIIELDVRKSRDGILYCYHGFIPAAYFLKTLRFDTIQRLLKVDTLEHVLEAIQGDPIIFCDIKDERIDSSDLNNTFDQFQFSKVWIAAFSFAYLGALRKQLDDHYKMIYNMGIMRFKANLEKAQKRGIDVVQLPFWHFTETKLEVLKKAGIDYTLWRFLMSRRRFKALAKKQGSLWIHYGNLETME